MLCALQWSSDHDSSRAYISPYSNRLQSLFFFKWAEATPIDPTLHCIYVVRDRKKALDAETLQLQLLLLVIRGRFRRGRRHHPREAKCFTARLKLHLSHLSLRVPRRLGFGQFINDKGVDIGHIRDCNSLGLGGLGFLHDLLGQDDNTFVLVWWRKSR